MPRIEHAPIHFLKSLARGHKIRQIAVRRRDQRTGPTHDMICCKATVFPGQADVVADVTRSVDDAQLPTVATNDVAIAQKTIGKKASVDTFAAADET